MTDRVNKERDSPSVQGHLLTQIRPDVVVRSSRALGVEGGRRVVVVLGMHRSGTSLLSNVLHSLGVDMADTTDHVSPKNAGGFWERPELTEIHDEILAAIEQPIGRVTHVLPFPPAWWRRKEVQALKPKLMAYVERELDKSGNAWGFKDPRTCRLLPLWWEVFRELKLRPVYVHAVRNPAESSVSMAQKSPARKMAAANSELMWLAYNYDVLRFVSAEHPTIMVDYSEWFTQGPSVAKRLAEELEIGDDLTPDDIAACVTSIVRSEYRHQVDGAEGVTSNVPLASMLYQAMSENSRSEVDARTLHGQLRLVDLFFKSLTPIVAEMDVAAGELVEEHRLELQMLADRESESAAQREKMHEAALVQHREEWDTEAERQRAADEVRQNDSAAQRATERAEMVGKLEAARAALEEARKAGVAASALAQKAAQERASLANQLAAMEGEANGLSQQIDQMGSDLARQAERISSQDDQMAQNRAQSDRRSQALLRIAKDIRHSQRQSVESSEEQLRETTRQLTDVRTECTLLEEQVADSLRKIEQLRKRLSRQEVGGPPAAFEWPADPSAYKVETDIVSVDKRGVSGIISIDGRPDIVPIVEIGVDDRMILAMTCTPSIEPNAESGNLEWHFLFPWKVFAPEHAGADAVIKISGIGHVVGQAAIPVDLRQYQIPPAELASRLIGGTVAEAEEYHRWIATNEPSGDIDQARSFISQSGNDWPPIIVLLYGKSDIFAASLESLCAQIYENWEAICVDAPIQLAEIDPRIRVTPATGLDQLLRQLPEDALCTFVEADDQLAPTALLHLVEAAREAPGFSLVYSDEDRIDVSTGVRALPHVKAGWSSDLALVQDFGSRLALVRRKAVESLEGLNAAKVYALTARAALTKPESVAHLPFVLYHRSSANNTQEADLQSAVRELLSAAPESISGASMKASSDKHWSINWPLPEPAPRVSLLVPTRDRADLLRVCVEGLLHGTDYPNLEVLIADNESSEPETLSYLSKVATHPRVTVVPCPGEFNFSAINNLAASNASGSLIGLINNDLKVIDGNWLRRMAAHAVRPDVGVVGAKLLYGDDTVQHAGVTLGIGIASHIYKAFPRDAPGRNGRLQLPQDLSAVTAACLLMRRDVWDKVGGLDEEFPVAYNDIDLCLKVRRAGFRVIWVPDVLLYHLESQSRGKDTAPEKRARLDGDKERLIGRWGPQLARDPFHSPNLSDRHIDARLAFPARVAPPWRSDPAIIGRKA